MTDRPDAPEPVHPMHTLADLATEIEAGHASREMSDRVLIALGCVPEYHQLPRHTKWRLPSGARFVTTPDPLKDLNAIAALERECGATVAVYSGATQSQAEAMIGLDAGSGVAEGDHAECRARAAALCRALAARTRTDQP